MKFKIAVMLFFDYVITILTVIANRLPGVSNANATVLFVASSLTIGAINLLILYSTDRKKED